MDSPGGGSRQIVNMMRIMINTDLINPNPNEHKELESALAWSGGDAIRRGRRRREDAYKKGVGC